LISDQKWKAALLRHAPLNGYVLAMALILIVVKLGGAQPEGWMLGGDPDLGSGGDATR
jgi:hypothetical protein